MNVKKYLKLIRLKYVFGIILFAFTLWLFWGPLFVLSPIKIGYETIKLSKANIFVEDKSNIQSTLLNMEVIMREEEEYHGLEYRNKVNILILKDNSDFKRFTPWLKQSRGATVLGLINTVSFGTNLQKDTKIMDAYMRHELSHALIAPYSSLLNSWEVHKQGWFSEGIATAIGKIEFFSKKELAEECMRRNISFDSVLPGNPRSFSREDINFRYTYFRYFVEFFREKYGIVKFHEFVVQYLENPKKYPRIYEDIFGTDIKTDIKNYGVNLSEKE